MIEYPNRPKRIGQLAVLGIAAAFVASSAILLACSKEEPPGASPATEPPPEPALKPEPAEPEPEEPAAPEPAPAANVAAPQTIANIGLATPESVLYDAESDAYLVSNINGVPDAADGNGFISRLSPDGSVQELKWIDGAKEGVTLNAPKGMALSGGTLYVADVTAVRKFDAKSGAPQGEIEIKGATFLNAVAAGPQGAVYVSDSGLKVGDGGFEDTGADAIYKITGDKVETLAKGADLGRPNGLLLDGDSLWVVTFGTGELYRIVDGKKADATKLPKGSLDGLIKSADGKLVISSWEGSELVSGTAGGDFAVLASDIASPAGLGYDSKRNLALVPKFNDNAVQIVPLPGAQPTGGAAPGQQPAAEEQPAEAEGPQEGAQAAPAAEAPAE